MKNTLKVLLGILLSFCLAFSIACIDDTDEPDSTGSSETFSESVTESDPASESESTGESASESESVLDSQPTVETYSIVFVDYDDSVITSAEYELGATVTVPDAPTRDADEVYAYEFAGWDSEVTLVDGAKTYKATYTQVYVDYTVTFVDEDGEEISSATYHYGDEVAVPEFPEVEPTAVGYPVYSWDKTVVAVDGNTTYTRVEEFVYFDYTVTFVDEDGTELSKTTYHYGDEVVEPDAPTKPADETYTYEFAGWDKEVVAVNGDATYTATYNPVYIDYTVTFVDEDGRELSTATYHYGDEVVVYEGTLVKAEDEYFTYAFGGWDKEVVAVNGDVTYTATYTATAKDGYSSLGSKVEDGAIVLGAGKIGGGANYTMGQNNDDGDDVPSFVNQSYFAIDGNYGLGDFIAFDFTGKNMPEVAFFAKNYDGSMYADGTSKQGIVVYTGITAYNGEDASITQNKPNGTFINYGFPFMIQDAANGGFVSGAFADSQLGRANLVDGKHYRVVMGFVQGGHEGHAAGITLKWYLYDLDENVVVEESSMASWGFFTGSNEAVNNMTLEDLVGSVVLYGKFGTTCTIDKLHGVYDGIDYETVKNGVGQTYSVTFKGEDGEELKTFDVKFGETVAYGDEIPEPMVKEDDYFTYTTAWDSDFAPIVEDTVYNVVIRSIMKQGAHANNISSNGTNMVLGAGGIGDGANYVLGQNNGGYVNQSYVAFDGNYGLNTYVAFDFTGKNMPEVAFFANNYDNSMYANGTSKQGIVVVTGITTWDGQLSSGVNGNGTQINYGFPFMIQDAANGSFVSGAFADSQLGRANLVDGKHYRVVMGFTGSGSAITLNWCLYDLDASAVVEQSSMTTWNFFTGSNSQVGNMTINDLSGSIVLYGKFGTTCTLDKIHGVFENATIEGLVSGLNSNATYTVTFKDVEGNVLQTNENVAFGAKVTFNGVMPTPPTSTTLMNYSYEWDKKIAPVSSDTVYTLKLVATAKSGYTAYNVTENGDAIVLGASGIGDGANYALGQNNGGYVDQSYLALDGNYTLNDYIALDFTGKNMPEIAFFAKNYNNSMYAEGTDKQGIVVVTGITTWDGQLSSGVNGNGTQINYGFPYMIQDAANGGFVDGSFASSQLGRANLVDGKHYRVIMGFTGSGSAITLNWCLYDLDASAVVEQSSMTTWNFFTGSNAQVGNMTINDLSGSIVLYGKFGTTCTIDKIHGVENGDFATVVAKYTA